MKITYEIEAGTYALVIKYRSHKDFIKIQSDPNFVAMVPVTKIRDIISALMEIERAIDRKEVANSVC